jgi:predicted RNA binding protein YcfA (HicA-like mRNA interferase family)
MSPRIPSITSRKLVAALLRAGFFEHHTTGSHIILRHQTDFALRVTVPKHGRDLKFGTVHNIVKQSGLSTVELLKLL